MSDLENPINFNSLGQFLVPINKRFLNIVWMRCNFLRFHEILNERDAENFSFLSWQTKKFCPYPIVDIKDVVVSESCHILRLKYIYCDVSTKVPTSTLLGPLSKTFLTKIYFCLLSTYALRSKFTLKSLVGIWLVRIIFFVIFFCYKLVTFV